MKTNKKLIYGGIVAIILSTVAFTGCLAPYPKSDETVNKPIIPITPKTTPEVGNITGIIYFDDWELINNTDSRIIKTIKPLTEEQIQILRDSGVRKLSNSGTKTIYRSLIEEDRIIDVEMLDFVNYTYSYSIK